MNYQYRQAHATPGLCPSARGRASRCSGSSLSAAPEFEALRANAARIKRFVALYQYLLAAPAGDDALEACRIVRALGYNAAALLPQLVQTYYCSDTLDVWA